MPARICSRRSGQTAAGVEQRGRSRTHEQVHAGEKRLEHLAGNAVDSHAGVRQKFLDVGRSGHPSMFTRRAMFSQGRSWHPLSEGGLAGRFHWAREANVLTSIFRRDRRCHAFSSRAYHAKESKNHENDNPISDHSNRDCTGCVARLARRSFQPQLLPAQRQSARTSAPRPVSNPPQFRRRMLPPLKTRIVGATAGPTAAGGIGRRKAAGCGTATMGDGSSTTRITVHRRSRKLTLRWPTDIPITRRTGITVIEVTIPATATGADISFPASRLGCGRTAPLMSAWGGGSESASGGLTGACALAGFSWAGECPVELYPQSSGGADNSAADSIADGMSGMSPSRA